MLRIDHAEWNLKFVSRKCYLNKKYLIKKFKALEI